MRLNDYGLSYREWFKTTWIPLTAQDVFEHKDYGLIYYRGIEVFKFSPTFKHGNKMILSSKSFMSANQIVSPHDLIFKTLYDHCTKRCANLDDKLLDSLIKYLYEHS